jgi:magnesium chelatase family protein
MSLALVMSRAAIGVSSYEVTVEVHLSNGLPSFTIVGLPETVVRESRERVRSAIINSGFDFPARRITVNLAPADLPKEGGRFDLPVAVGILIASGQLPAEGLLDTELVGELGLGGELRPIQSVFGSALACARAGRILILAAQDAIEATFIPGSRVIPVGHLTELVAHLTGNERIAVQESRLPATGVPVASGPGFNDVAGQYIAKRGMEIAAAGGHSLLLVGPPGAGKTMLASRFPSILPPLSMDEAMESASVRSVAGVRFDPSQWGRRPFRSPHHSASGAAMVGGGSRPHPGEISLAHNGVLFLDELPEFRRSVLELLREPMECGTVSVSRATWKASFPARFQLIGAMNPCPCGYFGDLAGRCRCTPDQVMRYRNRISGPLLDRIDMQITVQRTRFADLAKTSAQSSEASGTVRGRVKEAQNVQMTRTGRLNARLDSDSLSRCCTLDRASRAIMQRAVDRLGYSARAYHRVLKVARTIADLAGLDHIREDHVKEAMVYREMDRAHRDASATR